MTSMGLSFGKLGGAALVALLGTGLAAPAEASVRCLPTCSSTDGRFLAIAGDGLETLSPPELNLAIGVPAGSTSFDIGFFDGDGREVDVLGNSNWDVGTTALFDYTLYADPNADGTGLTVVELEPGFPSVFSDTMPDNAWRDFTISTGSEAETPSGNFFYVLKIRLLSPVLTLNSFKVRTTATVSGLTLDPIARPFSYIASWTSLTDLAVVYPAFPIPTPTTYDGLFRFYFDVPVSQAEVAVWDGDFDRGKHDLTDQDTDDADTPGAPFLPAWATVDTVAEGVAVGGGTGTGNPADDEDGTGFGVYILREPSIHYHLLTSDGQRFDNNNPSGNREWEQFKVSTAPFDSSLMDYSTSSLPPGTYKMEMDGVDMLNLNAVLLPFRVLCVEETGEPCVPLRPYLLGDSVFRDADGDGFQDGGEPGIPGVLLELRDAMGALVSTTTTNANGLYSFGVDNYDYEVLVAASNFTTGPLAGYSSTTGGESRTATVDRANHLDLDFGYLGTGSLAGRVWNDADGDGVQEAGEDGLNGVAVTLLDGGGNAVATTVTSGDGNYSFPYLGAGTYTVSLDGSTLPAGVAPTFDPDGTGTPGQATVALGSGEDRDDVDFGYRGTASLGDRVWSDLDGDGVQEAGEPGLNGVTVRLLDGGGNVIATTTTSGDGNYSFANLAAGTYTVSVDSSTLPAGLIPTYDLDGTGTPHTSAVVLAGGASAGGVDFGYRPAPVCTAGYFKDHFSSKSFSNNDGTLSWTGAWVENDVAGAGVSSGNVTVGTPVSGYLILRDSPDTGTQPSAARQTNLMGFASATLTVSFHIRGVEADDAAVIEVSNNGGASYTVLETLTGYTGTYVSSRTYDISSFIAGNTRIRFRIGNNYGGSDDFFKVDWVKIDAGCTPPPPTQPGTGTLGYWKNHPEAWPVAQITIGGTTYSQAQAISLMGTSGKGDKTYDMFKQLVAAKLNVLIGNDASCISATISAADSWMASYPLGSKVKASSPAWTVGGPLHEKLDDYNNGRLCAPHRD